MSNQHNIVSALMIGFAAGVLLAKYVDTSLTIIHWVLAISFLLAMAAAIYKPRWLMWLAVFIFVLFGIVRWLHSTTDAVDSIKHYTGQTAAVYGTIVEVPRINTIGNGAVGITYTIQTTSIMPTGADRLSSSGKMLVSLRQSVDNDIGAYGDKIAVTGKILSLHGYNNPGAYDSVAALNRQGIYARMATKPEYLQLNRGRASWQNVLAQMRQDVVSRVNKVMPPDDAAILIGTMFGGYSGIKQQVVEDFSATGLIHILSVSGSHIALVAAVLWWMGGRLGVGQKTTAIIAVLSIVFYAVFAGLMPPVIRSAVVGIIGLGAVLLGREKDAITALSLVALGMLIYQPEEIYDISFQLSFGSAAGLILLCPIIVRRLKFLPLWLAEITAATVSAQLAILPFLAWYFNSLSIVSVAANIIVLPVIELVVIIGLCGVIAGALWSIFGNILLVSASLLIDIAVNTTALLAKVPGSTVYLPPFDLVGGLIYYISTFWLFGFLPQSIPSVSSLVKERPVTLSAVAAALLLMCTFIYLQPQPVAVHMIDVGQGDSILVTTPHRRALLVDAGGLTGEVVSFDVGARVVLPYLKHYGVTNLDYLLLTHGHADHIGGAGAIVKKLPVTTILVPPDDTSPLMKDLLSSVPSSIVQPVRAGQRIILDGIIIDVIHNGEKPASTNESSVVVRVCYGNHSFLLTGDLESKGESAIINSGLLINSTVLKVGHHGAKTSSSIEFLKAVSPEYAVISVGYNNRFGHPGTETLQHLAECRARVFRTDKQGAVVFKTDGQTLTVGTFLPQVNN